MDCESALGTMGNIATPPPAQLTCVTAQYSWHTKNAHTTQRAHLCHLAFGMRQSNFSDGAKLENTFQPFVNELSNNFI